MLQDPEDGGALFRIDIVPAHEQVAVPPNSDDLNTADFDVVSADAHDKPRPEASWRENPTVASVSPQAVRMRMNTNLPGPEMAPNGTAAASAQVEAKGGGATSGGGVQVLFGGDVWSGSMMVETRCCGLISGAAPLRPLAQPTTASCSDAPEESPALRRPALCRGV